MIHQQHPGRRGRKHQFRDYTSGHRDFSLPGCNPDIPQVSLPAPQLLPLRCVWGKFGHLHGDEDGYHMSVCPEVLDWGGRQ